MSSRQHPLTTCVSIRSLGRSACHTTLPTFWHGRRQTSVLKNGLFRKRQWYGLTWGLFEDGNSVVVLSSAIYLVRTRMQGSRYTAVMRSHNWEPTKPACHTLFQSEFPSMLLSPGKSICRATYFMPYSNSASLVQSIDASLILLLVIDVYNYFKLNHGHENWVTVDYNFVANCETWSVRGRLEYIVLGCPLPRFLRLLGPLPHPAKFWPAPLRKRSRKTKIRFMEILPFLPFSSDEVDISATSFFWVNYCS